MKFIINQISGSRDGHVALWRVKDHLDCYHDVKPVARSLSEIPPVTKDNISLVSRKAGKESQDKVRALAYHKPGKEVAALSLNARIQIWDVEVMRQVSFSILFNLYPIIYLFQ